ncbi:la-related protein 6C-like [Juglans microcarpa x Juglans regia]|uniref:la-related protein 6C-like n=1 Tax=Juglans microcarpa x Juglans regia TaxID=2249226 RepID=UPI001B7F6DEE|nr:la-related protein 6C-like [Juglans microcarpa x Juglans regia]
MAQAQVVTAKKIQKTPEREKCTKKTYDGIMSFKFNARAREFVPRTYNHMPASAHFYPGFNFLGRSNIGGGRSDWLFVGYQEPPAYLISNRPHVVAPPYRTKTVLTDDLKQKIIKQVEYQFSNMSLLANESFVKHMTRDANGYVPISAIASVKKIKSLVSNNPMLAQALRSSSRLVVSDDGKKVRRKNPFTEKEKEELQSRIVVAGNLPEDHSHQNLEKIFGVVGSVKAIQICHPHESHSSCSKGDFSISNKLHALVEYETTDTAQKAVQKLNDKRKWRKGLRVRLLLRRSKKSVVKNRKSEFDGLLEEEEASSPQATGDSCQPNNRVTESRELTATSKRIQWDQKKDVVEGVQNREDEIKAMVSVHCSLPQVETSAK